jgi:signal transduction histidine kinase
MALFWLLRERVKKYLRSQVKRYEKPLMILTVASAVTAILLNFGLGFIEAALYDYRMTTASSRIATADARIELITLDDLTEKTADKTSPLPLSYHTRLLEMLERYHPRGIGYLIDMSQVQQLEPGEFQNQWGARFVAAAKRLEANGTAVEIGTRFDVTGEVAPPYPLSLVPHAIAVIHKDGNVFSSDKVTRRALVSLNGESTFHLDFAKRLGLAPPNSTPRGTFEVAGLDVSYFFFRYHGNPAEEHYSHHSFGEVMRGEVPLKELRNKIILIGTLSRESSSDFAFTPYSVTPFTSPKLVIHANILDSVIHNDGIVRLSPWINSVVTFSVTALVLWCVLSLTPLYSVFATLTLFFALLLVGHALFDLKALWLKESKPLIGIFVAYYLAVPYRLITEYRTRWEYQRKNRVLTQVEELKTNFLNLVTHDLKTPVARIQGLAEVLLRKAGERLIDRDRETIHHIISATDELNHFISSILELSKVESQSLQLAIESRDINQLIEKSATSLKAAARAKQIKMNMQLDPLFPIRIDANLISKVINNLIDNAIKYSRSGSEVRISSRENGAWIEIAVEDQGIGLDSSEQENLFTRFYRAKNPRTAETSGTGLGLYLTRYFVEAHGGQVDVTSERGVGSRFVILLPVEGPAKETVVPGIKPGLRRRIGTAVRELTQVVKE